MINSDIVTKISKLTSGKNIYFIFHPISVTILVLLYNVHF